MALVDTGTASSVTFNTGSNSKGLPRLKVYYKYTPITGSTSFKVEADLYVEAYDFFGSSLSGSYFTLGGSTKNFSGPVPSGSTGYISKQLIASHTATVKGTSFKISAYWLWRGTYQGETVTSVSGSISIPLPVIQVQPSKPIISNIADGDKFIEGIQPTISGNNSDYLAKPSDFEITYQFDGGGFLSTKREAITIGGKTNYLYIGNNITGYSSHTIRARAKHIPSGLITYGDTISFTITKAIKPVPVILGVSEGGSYLEATPTLKADSSIGTYQAYLNGSIYKMGTLITKEGSYNLRVVATHITSGETGEAQVNFKISNQIPPTIEVYGVVENDIKTSFNIHVIKQANCDMVIKIDDSTISPGSNIYNGRDSYNFTVTTPGTHKLYVKSTHKDSKLIKEFTINKFTVLQGSLSGNGLIRFKQPLGPVNSAQTILNSVDPIKNKIEYTIDGLTKRYSSPLLIFENEDVRGREINVSNQSVTDRKIYAGFIPYLPELPTINGTSDGQIHLEPVNISFINNASKPTQAMYKIFIDGDEIANPFSTSITVKTDGYHYVTILGWDNINPYNYTYKSIQFLHKAQNDITVRKPYIVACDNEKDSYVDVKIKFSGREENLKHSITITELDGSSKTTTYRYDVGTVSMQIHNNCTIIAKTRYDEMNIERTNTKVINTIFDTIPLNNIKLFGVNRYNFTAGSITNTFKIGRKCVLEIERRYNEEYEVYINGLPYNPGDIIKNRVEEIRKYVVEVIITNPVKNLKSYYSDIFYLDSINPSQPVLMTQVSNLMNRVSLPQETLLKEDINKSQEIDVLNNSIINVKTNILRKDDEYILTITYIYYDGTKRTNTFYFSINSNPIDDLKPDRAILKLLDYKKGDIAKEGELLVDRHTGHIYFKEGTIKPVTKNIEDEIIKIEKQLIKVESNHDIMQSIQFFLKDLSEHVKVKQAEYYSRVNFFKDYLDRISNNIDTSINEIDNLETAVNNTNTTINNYLAEISINKANAIKNLTNSMKTLNTNFISLCQELKDVFHRAAICTEKTYWLKDEIPTRVSIAEFNAFKQQELDKYQSFLQTLEDKGVV